MRGFKSPVHPQHLGTPVIKKILAATLLIFAAARAVPAASEPAAADSPRATLRAIRAGTLIDVTAGRALSNQIILIRGAKIEAVGPGTTVPAGAEVIDLSGMTVLPGLIDCHTHLADLVDAEPLDLLRLTAAQMAYDAIPNPRLTLLAGFTTVRDVGVYRAFNDVAMRDAIAKGIIIGPRMYVAGAYITISEGAGAMTGLSPDVQLPWDMRFGIANSPWEVRQKVRELAHRGADHIKIAAGKSADIIAVQGDPLADIRILEHVAFVMKEGTVYKHEQ
jgi:imidazolonepropionase-like amidohydrolase